MNQRSPAHGSLVYFMRIGRSIKIGITTNLTERIKSFRGSSAEDINVLFTIEGGPELEQRLHKLFAKDWISNEFFHDFLIGEFIDAAKEHSVPHAFAYIEKHLEAMRGTGTRKEQERQSQIRRSKLRAMTKAELNAHCAKLVTERKQKLGW